MKPLSLEEELRTKKTGGAIPTAFEVLQQAGKERPDWLRAEPQTADEVAWYRQGSAAVKERQISDPLPGSVPAAFRFWWVRGLMDAKARGLDIEWLPRKEEGTSKPEPDESAIGVGTVLGAVAGVLGLGLVAWKVSRRSTP